MTTESFSPDRPVPPAPDGTDPLKVDLVLEGGGVKGIGLAGAVLELAGAGYQFPRVAGASAGAIAAALIAALNAADEPVARLGEVLRSLDYEKFVAGGPVRAGLRLVFRLGLYDESYLVDWLGGWLERIGPTTFGDRVSSIPAPTAT
jgi:NTE family protein